MGHVIGVTPSTTVYEQLQYTEADIHLCKLCLLRTVNKSAIKSKHVEQLHLSTVKFLYIA